MVAEFCQAKDMKLTSRSMFFFEYLTENIVCDISKEIEPIIMNISSVPALISGILNLVLALVSGLYRTRDRLNIAFTIYTFIIALMSLGCFFLFESFPGEPSSFWAHFTLALSPLLLLSASYFILVLTGYIDRLQERLLNIPVIGFLIIVIGFSVLLSGAVHFGSFRDAIILFADPQAAYIGAIPLGPVMVLSIIYGFFILVMITAMVVKALRTSPPGPTRNHLRMTVTGLFIIYFSGSFLKLLPFFGIPGFRYLFISTSLASVIFFMAVVRYQFEQIRELNLNLERKVAERTRNLQEAQAQLVQSEKLASLNRLVSGMAHELNNPIGAVQSTNATFLLGMNKLKHILSKVDLESKAQKEADKIFAAVAASGEANRQGAERVADLVARMKGYIQLDEAELQQVDINEGLEDTLIMVKHEFGEDVSIIRDYGDLPPVTCFSSRLNQVFMNLLLNAAQALGEQGEILISTSSDGDTVRIGFRDNGEGIRPENLDKVFEPGFTTRGVGVGAGLGLTVAYQVIQDHQGEIGIKSDRETGTEVSLKLPVQQTNRG